MKRQLLVLARAHRFAAAVTLLLLMLSGPVTAAAATDADTARWTPHATQPTARLDDRAWAAFLARYVRAAPDGVNRVDYAAITRPDRAQLKRWLAAMQRVDVGRLTRPQQMAYWLNLYNAATVDVVADAYPVASIRDIGGGLIRKGPWQASRLTVEGQRLSLDDIEHRILRPIWKDPRIHYAVNCASIGCPNLPREPFRADRLDAQLYDAAVAFVNHPRGFRVVDGKLRASSIYDWYAEDFGGAQGVLRHARSYARGPLATALRGAGSIRGYDYDWRLNDTPRR